MTDLEKYEAVNHTESMEELAEVITQISENTPMIMGRTEMHSIIPMVAMCLNSTLYVPNTFTRMWGIRQQALMLTSQGKFKRKQ